MPSRPRALAREAARRDAAAADAAWRAALESQRRSAFVAPEDAVEIVAMAPVEAPAPAAVEPVIGADAKGEPAEADCPTRGRNPGCAAGADPAWYRTEPKEEDPEVQAPCRKSSTGSAPTCWTSSAPAAAVRRTGRTRASDRGLISPESERWSTHDAPPFRGAGGEPGIQIRRQGKSYGVAAAASVRPQAVGRIGCPFADRVTAASGETAYSAARRSIGSPNQTARCCPPAAGPR